MDTPSGNGLPEPASLLRFATVGSVDDGKSTLIGRLLFDARLVPEDQMAHVEEVSMRRGDTYVNLALLTDGLRAEREQGITIDVAYRYFRTERRRFIIADTPGHEQYTRNMVTGASNAELSLILVDARHGVREQSKRHAYVSALLGVPHLLVCVNKMDLVDFDQDRFEEIKRDIVGLGDKLGLKDVLVIPVSALNGDNIVEPSDSMPWYDGPTVLRFLEEVEVTSDRNLRDVRLPVQWVIRPMSPEYHDYRAFAGQLASGVLRAGDEVVALPSGLRTTVAAIEGSDGEVDEAFAPMSVSVRLTDEVDVSRGETICDVRSAPEPARELVADLCWMSERPLRPRHRCMLRSGTSTVKAIVSELSTVLDVATLDHEAAGGQMELNDIGRVSIRLASPLVCDPYRENRETGAFVLVDEHTNDTVAAGMVVEVRA